MMVSGLPIHLYLDGMACFAGVSLPAYPPLVQIEIAQIGRRKFSAAQKYPSVMDQSAKRGI